MASDVTADDDRNPFAPETTPPALLVTVDQYVLSPLSPSPSSSPSPLMLGMNAVRHAAVWLPAQHRHGHGLPKLGVVLGERGSAPRGVRMVVGLRYATPALADMITRPDEDEMRLLFYTRDEVAAYPVDGPVRGVSVESMRHAVTHQVDDGYVSLFSSALEEPRVTTVAPR